MFLVLVHILYKLQDLINTNTVCSKSLKILYKLCLVLLYIKLWNIASHPTRQGFIVIAIVIVFVLRSLYGNLLNSRSGQTSVIMHLSMLTPREGGALCGVFDHQLHPHPGDFD